MFALILFLCVIALGALICIIKWVVECIQVIIEGFSEGGIMAIIKPIGGLAVLGLIIYAMVDIFKDW